MKISNCPVYDLLWSEAVDEEVRYSYWICGRCGCEYGNDDNPTYRDWLTQGAPWFEPKQCPVDWNLEELRHVIPNRNAR